MTGLTRMMAGTRPRCGDGPGRSRAGHHRYAQETIKVGILHSLSGTMAISETTLKDTMLFLIDEQNKKGGVLGKQLEAVVVDPASDWPLFAEKARELISVNGVAAVFGCWTSVVAQVGAAGVQGAELDPLLPRAVRGRRVREERHLHRRRAEPAGDPRRRLPDERRRRLGEALGARSAPTTSIRARPTRSSSSTCSTRASRRKTS